MKGIKKVRFVRLFIVLSMLLLPLAGVGGVSAQTTTVQISEIRIDQTSDDNDEYFELAGAAGATLEGLTYLVIGDGASSLGSGVIEAVVDLTGQTIPGSGYFVAAESTFTLGTPDLVTNLNFENSDNVTHLLVSGFTGANGDDLDTNDDGTLDATPWTEIVDLIALVEEANPPSGTEFHYGPPSVGPDGSFVPGQVYACPDGWRIGAFSPLGSTDTPGAANNCAVPLLETTTSLVSSLNPADEGVEVTFTATVTPVIAGDVPTGTVTFKDGPAELAVVALDGAGQASFATDALNAGPHTITAEYSGDDVYAASSGSLTQEILGEVIVPDVNINEIRIDQTGGDDDEYFELAGVPGTSLDGVTYLVIGDGAGGSGVIEAVVDLTGQVIPASGYFVAAEGTFTLGTADLVTSLNFENSDNVTHLLVFGFTGSDGDDLDTDDDGVLDVTPWTEIIDLIALVETPTSGDKYYGPPSVGPDGSFVPGHVHLCADGWWIGEFDPVGLTDSPGMANKCVPVEELCGADFTPIYDIQGSDLLTPMPGAWVWVEGVVVADFQSGMSGFFLQDPTGDGDAATSDGIFVYDSYDDVAVGDHVRFKGKVSEYFEMTQLGYVDKLVICDALPPVAPTQVSLPVLDVNDWEALEGMLVTFPQTLYISEYYNFDRFGEIVLTDSRQYQPTAVFAPYSYEAEQQKQANLLGRIMLDDGRTSSNPDPAYHPNGKIFNLGNLFRGGDTIQGVTGVINYSYNLYRIQPTYFGAEVSPVTYEAANPRPELSVDVGGTLKVAAFNVLNYFPTIDTGAWICGPKGNMECRGADTLEEFERQRNKIFSALAAMDADVVGLMEIENSGVAVADLVDGLNAVVGAGMYDYVDTGYVGEDAITVAMIYKPATVSLVGDYAVLDSDDFVDPTSSNSPRNRPALAQTFIDNNTGGIFTVVVNHLKSKGSGCGVGDDDEWGGSCNLTRTLAAQVLLEWLATDPTGSADADFMIIGDLNSYDHEDPIVALKDGGYTDLLKLYQDEHAYSYVFDGQLGYLDYSLVSADLLDEVTGAVAWHINTDEVDLIDYDMSFKKDAQDKIYAPDPFRSSDHDPVITGLDVCDEIPPVIEEITVTPDLLWAPNHKYVTVEATVVATDNWDPNPTVTLVSVVSNEPDNGKGDGNHKDDIVIIDGFTFDLRAERSGLAEGRVYTITYQVMDDCGNTTLGSTTVKVPKSSYINKKKAIW